jgi:hypothetical protein
MAAKSSFYSNATSVYEEAAPAGPADAPMAEPNTAAPSSFYKNSGGLYSEIESAASVLDAAEASADAAAASAAAAAASAASADVSELAADVSEAAALASQVAAAASAAAALVSETNADTSEAAALASQVAAAASAAAALVSEGNADTSEAAAAASAAAALVSEGNADTSEANAATSASNAATSATAAATSATAAATSATAAAGSATAAAASATAADASADAALVSETNADASADAADISEAAALASQTAAAASATAAASSATSAASSASSAAASWDSFDDVYLGPKAVAPTLDNDGNALVEGQLYWNTATNNLNVYDGASWQPYSAVSGDMLKATYDPNNDGVIAAAQGGTGSSSVPSAAQVPVGNAGGTAYAPVTLSGDVTVNSSGVTAIGADKVANSMLANMAEETIKGREAGAGTGDPTDLTPQQALDMMDGSAALFDTLRYTKSQSIGSTDLDDLDVGGFYDGSNLTNSPDGSANWFYVVVQRHQNTNGFCVQHAYDLSNASTWAHYVRYQYSGAWGAWRQVPVGLTGGLAFDGSQAKLADMANATVKGRSTAGTGAPEDLTFTQLLDLVGSAAQGDVLYRNASTWTRLGAGSVGKFLKTGGAGADPSWVYPDGEMVVDQALNNNYVDVVLPSGYRGFRFRLSDLMCVAEINVGMRYSRDGGSSYDSGANYSEIYLYHSNGHTDNTVSANYQSRTYAQFGWCSGGDYDGSEIDGFVQIEATNTTRYKSNMVSVYSDGSQLYQSHQYGVYWPSATMSNNVGVNAIRFLNADTADNMTGRLQMWGIR